MASSALAGAAKIAAGGKGAADAATNLALRRGSDWLMGILLGFFWLVIPLIAVSIIMALELLLQYLRPSWQLPLWRKIAYIVTIFLTILLIATSVGTFLYVREKPDEACVAFGGVWSIVGSLGGCSVASDLFSAMLGGGGSFGGGGASGSW